MSKGGEIGVTGTSSYGYKKVGRKRLESGPWKSGSRDGPTEDLDVDSPV